MDTLLLDIGSVNEGDFIQGEYPRHNIQGYRTGKYLMRVLEILAIRDLNIAPLDEQTIKNAPLICRGAILLICRDCETGEERSFYLASFRTVKKIARPMYNGKAEPEQTFAIVDAAATRIIRRALSAAEASRYEASRRRMPEAERVQIVPEPTPRVSDDQVLARCG